MSETRCGFVALIGAPNAGKSTLVNALVGAKVSIVSRKVQTTRALMRGIVMAGEDTQIILVDTPGLFAPKRRLERAMVTTAWGGAGDADVVALIVDVRYWPNEETEAILEKLTDLKKPKLLVLNKIDLIEREKLFEIAEDINKRGDFKETFMVSALTGSGVATLRDKLASFMPPGPLLFPPDEVSDAPLRHLAAEITREKLFERVHDEIPYRSTVETEDWKTLKDGSARIEQVIYVERENQRKIVLGEGGRTIKAIGESARKEIADAADCKVHLFLFVKVRENWSNDPARYREMGLEFPKK
jgi:GTP-binding protein Era